MHGVVKLPTEEDGNDQILCELEVLRSLAAAFADRWQGTKLAGYLQHDDNLSAIVTYPYGHALKPVCVALPHTTTAEFVATYYQTSKIQYKWFVDILNELEQLHEIRFVHGDVRCSNIVIDAAGDAHLIDFGMSCAFEQRTSCCAVL